MIKKLSLCLLVISTGLVASCVNPFYENSVRRAEIWQPQIDMPTSVVVCRQKQCAPSKLSMSKEYIYNSLLHLLDNNSQNKALICRADPSSHVCTENYLTVPVTVGVTPANMYIDDVKITDVSASIGNKSLNVILNYNVTYNGQTPVCKPAKSLVYVKNANNIILEDAGYSCKMTTIGNTTIKTLFAIDYIDLDYGYIGGYYSIGLSGPAFGGDSGYMMLRMPQDAYPLSADLILKEEPKPEPKKKAEPKKEVEEEPEEEDKEEVKEDKKSESDLILETAVKADVLASLPTPENVEQPQMPVQAPATPLDANGMPVPMQPQAPMVMLDANGMPVPMQPQAPMAMLDANGMPVPMQPQAPMVMLDANGMPVPMQPQAPMVMLDANGMPIPMQPQAPMVMLDANGMLVPMQNQMPVATPNVTDGVPVPMTIDANGNPVPVVFDANGNPILLQMSHTVEMPAQPKAETATPPAPEAKPAQIQKEETTKEAVEKPKKIVKKIKKVHKTTKLPAKNSRRIETKVTTKITPMEERRKFTQPTEEKPVAKPASNYEGVKIFPLPIKKKEVSVETVKKSTLKDEIANQEEVTEQKVSEDATEQKPEEENKTEK